MSWTDPSQVPASAFPHAPSHSRGLFHLPHTHHHMHHRQKFAGYAGPTVAPLSHKIGTTQAALSETFEVLLKDGAERGWWTLSDLAKGKVPWWRLKQKHKRKVEAEKNGVPCEEDDCSGEPDDPSHKAHKKEKKDKKDHKGDLDKPVSPAHTRYPGYNTLPPHAPVIMMGGYRGSVLETAKSPDSRRSSTQLSATLSATPSETALADRFVTRTTYDSGQRDQGSPLSTPENSDDESSQASSRSSGKRASKSAIGRVASDLDCEAECRSNYHDDDGDNDTLSGASGTKFKHGTALFGHRAFPAFRKEKDGPSASPSQEEKAEKLWPNMAAAMFHPGHPDIAMLLMEECPDEDWDESVRGPQEVVQANNGVRATHMANAIGALLNLGWGLRRRLERMQRDHRIGALSRWGYDFRASIARSSSLLVAKAERLRAASPKKEGLTILTHSMGGLVVLHAVATAPDPTVFARIIFFGTPFQGCGGIMGPLRDGDGFLRQDAICDAVTTGCASPFPLLILRRLMRRGVAWPSSFHLLPTLPPFVLPNGDAVPLDLYDVSNWDTWGLSPLADGINAAAGSSSPAEVKEGALRDQVGSETGGDIAEGKQGLAVREIAQLSLAEDNHKDSTTKRLSLEFQDRPARKDSVSSKKSKRDSHRTSTQEASEAYLLSKGPYHPVNASPEVIRAHFARCLASVLQMREDILSGYSDEKAAKGLYPPMAIVASRSRPTVRGAMISKPTAEALKKEGHADLVFEWGDEVVTWEAATHMPGKWGRHIVKSKPAPSFIARSFPDVALV